MTAYVFITHPKKKQNTHIHNEEQLSTLLLFNSLKSVLDTRSKNSITNAHSKAYFSKQLLTEFFCGIVRKKKCDYISNSSHNCFTEAMDLLFCFSENNFRMCCFILKLLILKSNRKIIENELVLMPSTYRYIDTNFVEVSTHTISSRYPNTLQCTELKYNKLRLLKLCPLWRNYCLFVLLFIRFHTFNPCISIILVDSR